MTEISDRSLELDGALRDFVLHWGEMGGQWGVNRSVAQIHALLIVADRPLDAEEISRTLGLARSNASTSLRELIAWDLVRRAPVLGERRDHFVAEGDAWTIATRIIAMRKARELDPAKAVLKRSLAAARHDPAASPTAVARLADIENLIDLLDGWYGQMKDLPRETATPLIRLGARAVELLRPFLKKSAARAKDETEER
ncbi:MAG: GbsR/MarR family transcriptional regulator [Parvularculaceae bacterium]